MRKYTKREQKLAVDWALGKITQAEFARRLKKTSIGAYVALALILRDFIRTRTWN